MNELESKFFLECAVPLSQIDSSLLSDLNFLSGSDENLEWLFVYHKHPFAHTIASRLIYARFNILTQKGRELAENGQDEILRKCNVYSCETAWFSAAFAYAMRRWDETRQ